jgi:uncharacterized protein YneR
MLQNINVKMIYITSVLVTASLFGGCNSSQDNIQPFSTMLPSELHDVAIDVGYVRYEGRGSEQMGRLYNRAGGLGAVADGFAQLVSTRCPSVEIYKKNEPSGARVVIDAHGAKADYQKDFVVSCAIEILSVISKQPAAFKNAKPNAESWND